MGKLRQGTCVMAGEVILEKTRWREMHGEAQRRAEAGLVGVISASVLDDFQQSQTPWTCQVGTTEGCAFSIQGCLRYPCPVPTTLSTAALLGYL